MATYNPAPETQRSMAEARLDALRQEHYNLVINEVILEGQVGSETELRNVGTRLSNVRKGIANLEAHIATLPAATTEEPTA